MNAENQLVTTIRRLQVMQAAIDERLIKARLALNVYAPLHIGDQIAISPAGANEPTAPAPGNYTVVSIIPHIPEDYEDPLFWEVKMRGAKRKDTYELHRHDDAWTFGPDHVYAVIGNIATEPAA